MNQIEAGIKENQILGTRLAKQYAVLMAHHRWLCHDTEKGICKIFENHPEREYIYQVTEPLIDFYWDEVINNKSLKNVKIKAAKAISAWADIIDTVLAEAVDISYEDYNNLKLLLGRALEPIHTLSVFIHDDYSDLIDNMMDEWDCSEEIQTAHHKLIEISKDTHDASLRACLLTLKLAGKVFEHFESLIDEDFNLKEDLKRV